jgi:hypothetical protein
MTIPRRLVVSAVVLIVIVLAVAFGWIFSGYRDAQDAAACHDQYSQAHSAQDTALVDQSIPFRARGRGELGIPIVTCGELRRSGRVR